MARATDESDGQTYDAVPQDYIAPEKLQVVHFAPPAELAPFVTQIYFFRCEESHVHDAQPAALGHIVFMLRGEGSLKFHDGHIDKVHPASLFGPCTAAAEFTFTGPLYDLGFALTPLGFVALTGKSAQAYADRMVAASELFGPGIDELAQQFRQGLDDGNMRVVDMVDAVSAFLLAGARPVPRAHIALIQTVANWISAEFDPDVDSLYAQLAMSRSTASRLIARYFGSAPKPLMRKYRALRAASHLCDPACPPERRTKIESLFYDQPHMIREIRHFTGRTPGALDGDDAKILRLWLSTDNYRDLEAYPG
ncbi:MAG: helix-turn-helix domain-containing protein [Sphingorhabdus sp.]